MHFVFLGFFFHYCVTDTTGLEEQEKEKRRQVIEKFQKAPFEEIAAHCESKVRKHMCRIQPTNQSSKSKPVGRL